MVEQQRSQRVGRLLGDPVAHAVQLDVASGPATCSGARSAASRVSAGSRSLQTYSAGTVTGWSGRAEEAGDVLARQASSLRSRHASGSARYQFSAAVSAGVGGHAGVPLGAVPGLPGADEHPHQRG